MKPEETVDYNIKVAWHAISRMYNTQAAQNDITTSIGFVLLNIDQERGTPATKIAPLLGLETRSLTRILRSMEEKGLIYKQADSVDKRSVRIFLTELGLQAYIPTGLRLDRQIGHHGFPTDRGYAVVRPIDFSDSHFFTLAAWDAYRDVPADRWRAAGLSKPRTRKAFDAGQAANPPAALPPWSCGARIWPGPWWPLAMRPLRCFTCWT